MNKTDCDQNYEKKCMSYLEAKINKNYEENEGIRRRIVLKAPLFK